MYLGIEIGGTKLQAGVAARGGEKLLALERAAIDAAEGATGILRRLESLAGELMSRFDIERIGVGFGGPVDSARGIVTKSHQVAGWEDFHLADWLTATFERPAVVSNDCDAAAVAEARYGAGRGRSPVLYITVGTGVGGGLVIDGQLYGKSLPAVIEIGHLRPGLHADRPESTVESIASGWGIAAAARQEISGDAIRRLEPLRAAGETLSKAELTERIRSMAQIDEEYVADLLSRCDLDPENITGQMVATAAEEGNEIAGKVFGRAVQTLGWGIAQAITLLAPQVVVVGGGVALAGEHLFLEPLARQVQQFVFPPLGDAYQLTRPAFGETVVVHGAIALAAEG